MARAALPGRLGARLAWRVGRLVAVRAESATAKTLVLDVAGWPGHLAGQHVDLRLTAPDGYSAQRSYSIANAVDGERVELTIQKVPDGEVSPYLTDVVSVGDPVELRGPVGGWFVWRPVDPTPVLLIAGGSGLVPLMAMVRSRASVGAAALFRLIYSVRSPDDLLYADELRSRGRQDAGLQLTIHYTRVAPADWPGPPRRIDAGALAAASWPAEIAPACFVCGPTSFVEAVADILVSLGHDSGRIKTERFG